MNWSKLWPIAMLVLSPILAAVTQHNWTEISFGNADGSAMNYGVTGIAGLGSLVSLVIGVVGQWRQGKFSVGQAAEVVSLGVIAAELAKAGDAEGLQLLAQLSDHLAKKKAKIDPNTPEGLVKQIVDRIDLSRLADLIKAKLS